MISNYMHLDKVTQVGLLLVDLWEYKCEGAIYFLFLGYFLMMTLTPILTLNDPHHANLIKKYGI